MQLCCTMKTGANILWTKYQQIGSMMLILLFFSIATAPLFHHHEHSHIHEHANAGDELIQMADKCALCDYYHHVSKQQMLLFYPQLTVILNTDTIKLDNRLLISNYKFTLQGFTNKGPPALIS